MKCNDGGRYLENKPCDWSYTHQFLQRVAVRGSMLLDVGCGDGEKLSYLGSLFSRFVGVDLSLKRLKKAKERNVEAILGDARYLPIGTASFGTITCFHVIEHVYGDKGLLDEIYRVLKSGGLTLLVTPNRRRITSVVSLALRVFKPEMKFPMNPDHVFEYTEKDLQYLYFRRQNLRRFIYNPYFWGSDSIRQGDKFWG